MMRAEECAEAPEPAEDWDGLCQYLGACKDSGVMRCDCCDLMLCCACGGYIQVGALSLVGEMN